MPKGTRSDARVICRSDAWIGEGASTMPGMRSLFLKKSVGATNFWFVDVPQTKGRRERGRRDSGCASRVRGRPGGNRACVLSRQHWSQYL